MGVGTTTATRLTSSRASFDGWSGSAPGPASCPIAAAAGSAKVVAPVAGSNQKRFPSGVADRTHVTVPVKVPVKTAVVAATPPPSVPGEPGDGPGGSIGPVSSATKLMSPIRSIAKTTLSEPESEGYPEGQKWGNQNKKNICLAWYCTFKEMTKPVVVPVETGRNRNS